MILKNKVPEGPLADKWTKYKSSIPLVSPANKRRLEVLVIGTGLAGGSAAASLAEMGYRVKAFCFQDSPRRAHSKISLRSLSVTLPGNIFFAVTDLLFFKNFIISFMSKTFQ